MKQVLSLGTSNSVAAAATPAPLPGSPNRQIRESASLYGRPSAFPRLAPSRLGVQGTEPPNPKGRKRNTSPKRQTGSTTGRDVRITPITVEVLNWQTASKGILPRWPTAADRLTRRPNNLRHPHGIRRGQHHPAPPFSTAPRRRFQPPSTGVSVLPVVGCC